MSSISIADSKTHVLVLDDAAGPSIYNKTVYSDMIDSANDNIALFILTSKGGLSDVDKQKCVWFELDEITHNAMTEVVAWSIHQKYRIDLVVTKQEDLILRAAHLRRLLECKVGLYPEQAIAFRDKELMKRLCKIGNVSVPNFERIRSPADVLGFIRDNDFPVIIKPVLGSASAGISVINNQTDLYKHFATFYSCLNDNTGRHDHPGDVMIEKFIKTEMFHVNGYARNGDIVLVWPFAYTSTNLDFTKGKAYGNIFISKRDARWSSLVRVSKSIISALPKTRDLFFHIELFQDPSDHNNFMLCEVAARRPGGSIALLMDMVEQGQNRFTELEFRLSLGLNPRYIPSSNITADSSLVDDPSSHLICGDMMVPLQKGTLLKIPQELPAEFKGITYKPLAKPGHVYNGFDVTKMNTCARLVASGFTSFAECQFMLNAATRWFQDNVVYDLKSDTEIEQSINLTAYEPWIGLKNSLEATR